MSTHNIPFSISKRKISNLQLWDYFRGTQAQVRNSHGKPVNEPSVFEPLKSTVYDTGHGFYFMTQGKVFTS